MIYAFSMKYFIYIEALFHIFRCYWGDRSGRWLYRGRMRISCFGDKKKTRFKLKCVFPNFLFFVTHAVIPLSLSCHCKSYFPNNIKLVIQQKIPLFNHPDITVSVISDKCTDQKGCRNSTLGEKKRSKS